MWCTGSPKRPGTGWGSGCAPARRGPVGRVGWVGGSGRHMTGSECCRDVHGISVSCGCPADLRDMVYDPQPCLAVASSPPIQCRAPPARRQK